MGIASLSGTEIPLLVILSSVLCPSYFVEAITAMLLDVSPSSSLSRRPRKRPSPWKRYK